MKKIISIVLFAALALPIMAEEVETLGQTDKPVRNYSEWLPAAGDWSIGFSLDPIATFVGNAFNNSTRNVLGDMAGESLLNNMASIMGSYMLTDQLAVRANIGLSIARNNQNEYVIDDAAVFLDPLSRQKVIDSKKYSKTGGSIALGVDYRVGKRRVQGVFGGGIMYAFSENFTTYSYGNGITEMNQVPTISNNSEYEQVSSYIPNARKLKEYNEGGNHHIGVYGQVGVEWFVAPKISLGASVNLIIAYSMSPMHYTTYEGWNTLSMECEKYTELKSPMNSGFKFGTENIGANLYAAFYF